MKISDQALLGLNDQHICEPSIDGLACRVHKDIVEPFLALQADAKRAGIDLQLASGFRDFDRQMMIWRAKAGGERDLLDEQGEPLVFSELSEDALLRAIMRWSAIPGSSRHHWGTDVDVIDRAAIDDEYRVQLTQQECCDVFHDLHQWLDERIANDEAHGFFRAYAEDRGGVSPEPWHLSYAPLAWHFQQQLTPQMLWRQWEVSELPLLDQIRSNWDTIWQQYILIPEDAYPANAY